MRLLRHPHIVDLHSCFVDGPSIYLILGACNYGIATFLYSEALAGRIVIFSRFRC